MNKTNGAKDAASASTSLYSKEHNYKQRSSSSAFPTFLKWFKKNEKRHKPLNGDIPQKNSQFFDSHDTLSAPSSPFLGNLSPSSSCDSVLSTSTTGFAFIKPQYYKPYNSGAKEPKLLVTDNPTTESYKRRTEKHSFNVEKPQISLREKYFLYDTDTLTSNEISETGYDNVKYIDRSLPNAKKKSYDTANRPIRRRHRRAVSDSSKDKKSGAYVHVKGKRKAPPPPLRLTNGIQNKNEYFYDDIGSSPSEIYSCGSTLGRKKRKAPPPPPLSPKSPTDDTPKSVLSEGLLDDKEIKAIIDGTSSGNILSNGTENTSKMFSKRKSIEIRDNSPADKTKSLSNEDLTSGLSSEKSESSNKSPISPISPRPWYKRPISSHRDSSIPFKREIALKTMEKRRNKLKEKETASNQLPEVGYSRSSMFDSGHKFGFFLRHKDHSDENKFKDKDKRRSGIGIPNISELDREAAEIVNKEHANEKAREMAEQAKFFNPPEHVLLQQRMFASKGQIQQENEPDPAQQIVSTKDLITKFESTSNGTRITLNTSFIGRTENFFQDKTGGMKNEEKPQTVSNVINKPETEITNSTSIFSNTEITENTKIEENYNSGGNELIKGGKQERNETKINWSCPVCTLLNPNWRIICAACENLKPSEKVELKSVSLTSEKADPLLTSMPDKKNILENKNFSQGSKDENRIPSEIQLTDWEKKAERVMKYFMPRNTSNALAKSSSETAVVKKPPVFRKSPSPSKLPISSPIFSRRSKVHSAERIEIKPLPSNIATKLLDKKIISKDLRSFPASEKKQPLLDSSVIVTTITPVFYASTTVAKQPETVTGKELEATKYGVDLKEVRTARLAKFSLTQPDDQTEFTDSNDDNINQILPAEKQTSINDENDLDCLEKEKSRLREKIRAMNAKALAERYPVLPRNMSEETARQSPPHDKAKPSDNKNLEGTKENPTKHGAVKKVLNKNRTYETKFPVKVEQVPAKTVKPQKVSTSVQTSGYVKKSDESKSSSRELLSEDLYDIKLDNLIYSNIKNEDNSQQFSEHDKERVEKISQQLQSAEGISDFKATLRNTSKAISRTDTIALNKIMRNLELAIAEGQDELAAKIAMDLAKMKISLQVTKVKNRPISGTIDYNQSIIVDLFVEDRISQKGPIQIPVKPLMTISELKEKALKDFEIPVQLQKWLINDEPATDNNKTLLEYGVRDSTSGFYLYLITPEGKVSEKREVRLPIPKTSIAVPEDIDECLSDTSSDSHNDPEVSDTAEGAAALPFITAPKLDSILGDWACPLCTLINPALVLACCACSKAKPHSTNFVVPYKENFTISEELRQFLEGELPTVHYRSAEQKNDLNKTNPNRKSSEIFNIVEDKLAAQASIDEETQKKGANFLSPNITKNKYRGVDNFNPNSKNCDGISITSEILPSQVKKGKPRAPAPPTKKNNHYLELLQLDTSDVVFNMDPFECPVCFTKFETNEGIVLRECLHSFCKECLANTVRYSDEAEIKCPYMDAEYSCDSILQEREIKAIASKEVYEQYLAKSIRVAEHQIENAFHCKTPNCRGWCIYEDNVNEFKCPVCRITNCLMCRVIHDGLTCKQYQDRLNSDCDSNLDARQTRDMLTEMVEKGEAMNCPTCHVIMMKKWGCDWLKCSMCKTEVCWVTRGPRWGPGGKGDTTGGCKCGVEGKKCHPKCNYCH